MLHSSMSLPGVSPATEVWTCTVRCSSSTTEVLLRVRFRRGPHRVQFAHSHPIERKCAQLLDEVPDCKGMIEPLCGHACEGMVQSRKLSSGAAPRRRLQLAQRPSLSAMQDTKAPTSELVMATAGRCCRPRPSAPATCSSRREFSLRRSSFLSAFVSRNAACTTIPMTPLPRWCARPSARSSVVLLSLPSPRSPWTRAWNTGQCNPHRRPRVLRPRLAHREGAPSCTA